MVQLLPLLAPVIPPTARTDDVHHVRFRHPAYPESEPELLRLNAVDGPGDDGDGRRDGIDYYTAFIACCIVTGNTWGDGWLAEKTAEGSFSRMERPPDGILRGQVYYFLLGDHGPEYEYPVHPSFDHWRFPHGDLPFPWSALKIPPVPSAGPAKQKIAAAIRDETCRLSGHRDATECAHLVPLSAGQWYTSNAMERYIRHADELYSIDDEKNLLLLRRDIHHLWDQRRFTFTVKITTSRGDHDGDTDETTCQLTSHVLLPQGSMELVQLYHNRTLHAITGVSVELLFARFAWSIFTDTVVTFFRGMQEFSVLVFEPQLGTQRIKKLRGPQVRNESTLFKSYSRSRSVSPRKRNIDEVSQQDNMMNQGSESDGDDEEPRGRSRSRAGHWREEEEESCSPPSLSRSFQTVTTPDLPSATSLDSSRRAESAQKERSTALHANSVDAEDIEGQRPKKRCRVP